MWLVNFKVLLDAKNKAYSKTYDQPLYKKLEVSQINENWWWNGNRF